MIAKTKIGSFRATWVLRHRWEEGDAISNYTSNQIRNEWNLGIWAKKNRAVGRKRIGKNNSDTIKKTFEGGNIVNCYMIGLNLIVAKVWVDFRFNPTLGSK
jgi:hypothetical protein